ncbi:MAG TPA: mismatch-specific DNA-glycosylase [Bosea sp. (in: a-proteobacteria)]|uniref:mismatch-specific DNA-glycosylase n=1 Tax=Bosea sp. (in: a-proteobacteria) TaxID=1871050 RepID=UPI002E15811F|nr:mismatch-specific DNA-glycosylase [Bosea sp. (in: a-proteobacteria)]
MAVLPDILVPGLRVVFCGTQAGAASARRGAYYAGPGNKFWKTLHEIGLTPERLAPEAFPTLPDYGIGLTDVAKLTSGPDTDLRSAHFDAEGLMARMALVRPRIVAFNGKRAAQAVLGPLRSYGLQPVQLVGAEIFVLPSTSGAASGFWSIEPWKELAAHLAGTGTR